MLLGRSIRDMAFFYCEATITMTSKRDLTITNLDQIMPEVDRLLAGNATVGEWSLGQICHHLALALRSSARARGPVPDATPEQTALRQRFFAAGVFPPGRPAPAGMLPKADLDAREEAERLRSAVEHFKQSEGPYPAHPALGPLERDDWLRFHCIHAAHHLGFALPQGG